jgi:hypothetical protein
LNSAIVATASRGMKQPGLIIIGVDQFYLKLVVHAVKLGVGCVSEAMGYVFGDYFVFNCSYQPLWHMVFCFLEEVVNIPKELRSVKYSITIRNFVSKLSKVSKSN